MPRPRSLATADIAAAALRIVERDGLDALSMRAVATALGVGTMSLYRYVDGRDEIEGLAVAAVLDRVETDVPADDPWHGRVEALMVNVRAAVAERPAVTSLLLTHRHRSLGSLRWGEAMLRALADGGFTGQERAIAFRALLSYLFGALQVEHLSPLSGEGTAALAELPAEDYPHLAATAQDAQRIPPIEEFRRGLAIILRGLHGADPGWDVACQGPG